MTRSITRKFDLHAALVAAIASSLVTACGANVSAPSGAVTAYQNEDLAGERSSSDAKIGSGLDLEPLFHPSFARGWLDLAEQHRETALTSETLWAVAVTGSAPERSQRLLAQMLPARGVVPHGLVPIIREQVASDPNVRTIIGLPGNLRDLLGNLFLDDRSMETRIRSGFVEKLKRGLPRGTTLSEESDFRFELFPALPLEDDDYTPASKQFSLSQQINRWHLVFSHAALWDSNQSEQSLIDQAPQVLQTSATLSEWKYMFGLDQSTFQQGRRYGGLARQVDTGFAGSLASFDPRENVEGAAFFTGTYHINFLSRPIMDLALSARETWHQTDHHVDLDSQARLWTSAAMAFSRLKPTARDNISLLFAAQTDLWPNDTHELPLAFLPP